MLTLICTTFSLTVHDNATNDVVSLRLLAERKFANIWVFEFDQQREIVGFWISQHQFDTNLTFINFHFASHVEIK